MLIDRYVNMLLGVFGALPDGSKRLHFHSQNLNEDDRGKPKGLPWHGRWWLRAWTTEFRLEWVLGSWRCRFAVTAEPRFDDAVMVAAAFPPVVLYAGLSAPVLRRLVHRFNHESWALAHVAVHDWRLWWQFWTSLDSWSSKTPKWRDGSWSPGKTFFGPWVFDQLDLESRAVTIPMPEGEYGGTATLYHATRGHKRSPLKHRNLEVKVDLPGGIPYSGKGENSWDCGEDGLYGWSGEAKSIEEAIGKVVGSVLKTRRKRGDPAKWPKSPAEQRAAREARGVAGVQDGAGDAGA